MTKETEKKFVWYGENNNHNDFTDCFNKYWYKNIYLQNATVEELLKNDSISIGYEDIQNLYMTEEEAKNEDDFKRILVDETLNDIETDISNERYQQLLDDYIYERPKEFYQWFLITDTWLFNWLKENNEVVLDTDYGSYWGRCTFGQSIELDYIFAVFYNFIIDKGFKPLSQY